MAHRPRTSRRTALGLVGLLALAACSDGADDDHAAGHDGTMEGGDADPGGMGGHDHPADGGPPPEGIAEATDPTYPVGSTVILSADHMPGMDGAEATIDSSTQETVYMVDLEIDGMTMTNHQWVVESEMQPVG